MLQRVRYFNDEEIRKLLKNNFVVGIKNKSQIIYRNDFKYWAVMQKIHYPYKTSREIFERAGFDMSILSDRTPSRRIAYWTDKYKKFGKEYFVQNNKYRYKALEQNKKNSDDEKIIIAIRENNILIHNLINAINKIF